MPQKAWKSMPASISLPKKASANQKIHSFFAHTLPFGAGSD
jgi:hypothetical protein